MHLEILIEEQVEFLLMFSINKRENYLVGGTAMALPIDH